MIRIFFHLLTYIKTSNHLTDINLLVSTSEVSSVMATSFNPKRLSNITFQVPITCIHFLDGRLPSQYLLLHDWAIRGKVHTVKTDVTDKTVLILVQPVKMGNKWVNEGIIYSRQKTELSDNVCLFCNIIMYSNESVINYSK